MSATSKIGRVLPKDRFAVNLRRARTAAGLSQEELGERTDLHRTEISLLERAGREPRLGTIVKLAGALETTTAAELLDGMDWDAEKLSFRVQPPPKA